MYKIRFVDAQEVKDGEGVVYQKFKAGQVVELGNASAMHWLSRGMAVEVQGGSQPVVQLVQSGTDAKPESEPPVVSPTFPKRGRGRPRSVSVPDPASDKNK